MSQRLIWISLIFICSVAGTTTALAQQEQPGPLTNQDVIRLVNENKITAEDLKKISVTASSFDLSPAGLKQLQDAKVDPSIIASMIQSPRFKGDWYVADVYYYHLDSLQLSGTNFLPSLFNPLLPGLVYLLLLALLWLGIMCWASNRSSASGAEPSLPHGTEGTGNIPKISATGATVASASATPSPRSRAFAWMKGRLFFIPVLIILLLLISGALMGYTHRFGGSYPAISVAEINVKFLSNHIIPDQDPCQQVLRRPLASAQGSVSSSVLTGPATLSPYTTPTGVRETDAVLSRQGSSPQTGPIAQTGSVQKCRQPDTSATPKPETVGMVISADGSTGHVSLETQPSGQYVLTITDVPRAGKYTGHISNDVIAPEAMPVALNVSDWWPYFFVAVALGAIFSNYSFIPKPPAPLSSDEKMGAQRATVEAFIQGVNSTPVTGISALVAVVIGLYANYGPGWGSPTDYVAAFLGGAAITIGLRTLAGAANATATRLERALKKEPSQVVHEVHFQPTATDH